MTDLVAKLLKDILDALKEETSRRRVIELLLRYTGMFIVGLLVHYGVIDVGDKQHFLDYFDDPKLILAVGSGTVIILTALQSFITQKKETLTAAASGTTMTPAEVTVAAKSVAPSMASPANEVPQLKPPPPDQPPPPPTV